jgi:quercetin 2,3-dioxygenase
MQTRAIRRVFRARPTTEGAGVHLKRAFGFVEMPQFDPFLMLDDFSGDDPAQYKAGFPSHPHRGMETITYVLQGSVEHSDSMGNRGVIRAGDVQWMTAGSGIIHQEMPTGDERGGLRGIQLWANLPATDKMMSPRYREIASDQIPEVTVGQATVRVIAGKVDGVEGPVRDVVIHPLYLDVTVPPHSQFAEPISKGHTAFVYVLEGEASFAPGADPVPATNALLFDDGDLVEVTTRDTPVRFLLVAGMPLHEPVAWYGPVVMNTQEELDESFDEIRHGTFVKGAKV